MSIFTEIEKLSKIKYELRTDFNAALENYLSYEHDGGIMMPDLNRDEWEDESIIDQFNCANFAVDCQSVKILDSEKIPIKIYIDSFGLHTSEDIFNAPTETVLQLNNDSKNLTKLLGVGEYDRWHMSFDDYVQRSMVGFQLSGLKYHGFDFSVEPDSYPVALFFSNKIEDDFYTPSQFSEDGYMYGLGDNKFQVNEKRPIKGFHFYRVHEQGAQKDTISYYKQREKSIKKRSESAKNPFRWACKWGRNITENNDRFMFESADANEYKYFAGYFQCPLGFDALKKSLTFG